MKTKYPLVSVVIPIYNMQAYLAETIESVIASSYPNFEVILMDDGSTDASAEIAQKFVAKDNRLKFFSQPNGGASTARNNAIRLSNGKYILPVDADNHISSDYIKEAVQVLDQEPDVKIVYCEAEFFGDKKGPWKLPPYSLKLLARKNIIDNCAMYRKSDWEKAGGYCEEILGPEDWDFWISMLKNGGIVRKLHLVGLHYRVTANSKRKRTRHLKKKLIRQMNLRHKAFFYRTLGGKLRKSRTWSKETNFLFHLIHPENIFCNKAHSDFEEFVYSSPEFYAKNGKEAKFNILGKQLIITEYKEDSCLSQLFRKKITKSKARSVFESTSSELSVGYYEVFTFFWLKKSYHIYFLNN